MQRRTPSQAGPSSLCVGSSHDLTRIPSQPPLFAHVGVLLRLAARWAALSHHLRLPQHGRFSTAAAHSERRSDSLCGGRMPAASSVRRTGRTAQRRVNLTVGHASSRINARGQAIQSNPTLGYGRMSWILPSGLAMRARTPYRRQISSISSRVCSASSSLISLASRSGSSVELKTDREFLRSVHFSAFRRFAYRLH
jgi:hypothetical protein